jgi:hypothetical protein
MTWDEYNSAYPEALVQSGEAERNRRGFADTDPMERGINWQLYNAQVYGEGEIVKMVKAAKRAHAASTRGAQP